MATIVRSKKDDERYVLLGSGFGAYQSTKPNWFFGNFVADVDTGQCAMVCVCNPKGSIGWMKSSDVQVESVDGVNVESIL
jgi:hypothetical protein